MRGKVIPFRRREQPKPKPTFQGRVEERVEESLKLLIEIDLAQFAGHLAAARELWRKYPELVAAEDYPAHLRAAFKAENGEDDEPGNCNWGVPVMTPERIKELRERAIQCVQDEDARQAGAKR